MAALQGLLYIMHYVCGQKPDILIYKITIASKSNLEFRNRNKFRLQFCKDLACAERMFIEESLSVCRTRP